MIQQSFVASSSGALSLMRGRYFIIQSLLDVSIVDIDEVNSSATVSRRQILSNLYYLLFL